MFQQATRFHLNAFDYVFAMCNLNQFDVMQILALYQLVMVT